MKTIEQLFEEIKTSDELKKEAAEIKTADDLLAFFKKHDCNATIEEYKEYLLKQREENKDLDLKDLEDVNGGIGGAIIASLIFGLGPCIVASIYIEVADPYDGGRCWE